MSRTNPRRAGLLLTVAALASLLVVAGPTPGAAPQDIVSAPAWEPCFFAEAASAQAATGDRTVHFECATYAVPLDYDDPSGPTMSLALTRLPARRAAARIGSLFVNPGGPGASGVDFVVGVGASAYDERVRDRFDIVGFDPRGVARSAQLRCFGTNAAWFAVQPGDPFPVSRREVRSLRRSNRAVAGACRREADAIAGHMSTANVARDMDLLRRAVGDEALTYAGYSYGTYLGVTYANLFPDRVRAMVIDGVVDPIAYATGRRGQADTTPFPLRLGSHLGAEDTLDEFFRLCDRAGDACPFSGNAASRFAQLLARVRVDPIVVDGDSGEADVTVTEQVLVVLTLSYLYNSLAWEEFADILDFLAATPRAGAGAPPAWLDRFAEAVRYRGQEAAPGVACSETLSPPGWDDWVDAATTGHNIFRRPWVFGWSICTSWPFVDDDRYLGPFDAETSAPLLVTTTTFDPATPLQGAQAVDRLVPRSRLLTVNGWGHTTLFLSTCADRAVGDYLVNRQLPRVGKVCRQDPDAIFGQDDRGARAAARSAAVDLLGAG